MAKIRTDKECHCGETLDIEVSRRDSEGGVGWGRFSRDAGKVNLYMRCVCGGCGAVFDPDHSRFAAYYNMAADR